VHEAGQTFLHAELSFWNRLSFSMAPTLFGTAGTAATLGTLRLQ
jgi:hypothetical protein